MGSSDPTHDLMLHQEILVMNSARPTTRRCLVTGATGFLGNNLVEALVAAGHEVVATGAPGSTTRYLDDLPVEVVLADLTGAAPLDDLVADIDWVFHVAGDTSTWRGFDDRRRAVNVTAVERLADAGLRAGVERFIHTSTVDVLGWNPDGSPVHESAPGLNPYTGMGYDYAETKTAGERAVRDRISRGLDVVVVYPGFMIGPLDHTLQLGRIVLGMQAGRRTFAPSGASSFCDVRSVAAGMIAAAEHGRVGEGYVLAGPTMSYVDLFGRIAQLVGAPHRPIRVPAPVLVAAGVALEAVAAVTRKAPDFERGMARYLSSPQSVLSTKAEQELGYSSGALDDAIRAAAQWYQDNPLART